MIVTGEHICAWVAQRTGGEYYGGGQGIGWELDGVLKAGAFFENYCGKSVMGHVAMDTTTAPREWMNVCFHYVFDQLKVKKLIGIVDSTNEKAIRFDKHLGYIHESTIKDAGKHGDTLIFTMTREQCRYLKD